MSSGAWLPTPLTCGMNWALYGLGVAASVAAVVTGHAWYLVALVPATFRTLRAG